MATFNTKYSTRGGFNTRVLANVRGPPELVQALADMLNCGVAANTWRSYKTAARHVERIQRDLGIRLSFPMSVEDMLTYVGYLRNVRKVSGATLDKYLSGLRMAHLTRGVFTPWTRPDILKLVVTGAQNRDQVIKRMAGKNGRLPVTPEMMRILRKGLSMSNLTTVKKRLLWLVASWCWSGAFRIHEILARDRSSYDPTVTLMARDVTLSEVVVRGEEYKVVKVFLKHPKEERLSAGVFIDLFEVKGEASWLCPVMAYKKWKAEAGVILTGGKPLMRTKDSFNYTGANFNKDLKRFFGEEAARGGGTISSHSFRAGLATAMSKANYSDEEIMAVGRWRSSAFLRYIKTPREKRAMVAQELAGRMARMAICR